MIHKSVMAILIFASTNCFAQDIPSSETYNWVNLFLPGFTRIQDGDNSGYFTLAGTAASLGGTAYILTKGRGFSFDSSLPYAFSMLSSAYGTHAMLYEFYNWDFRTTYPSTTPAPTYLESITYPLAANPLKIENLAIGGIVSLFALYAYRNESDSIYHYFSSKSVPLWGMEMNPYLATALFFSFAAITNTFVAPIEEMLFRGLFLGSLAEKRFNLDKGLSVLSTALFFGLYHLGNLFTDRARSQEFTKGVIRQTVSASLMGLALGFFYLLDDSPGHKEGLAYATRLHFWNNVVAMNGNYWVSIGKTKSIEATPVPATSEGSGLAISITPFQISARFQY